MRMNTPHGQRRGEHGNVLVFATLALIALFGFAAWSTETGQAWSARGQLQAACDSAALAGAGELFVPDSGAQSGPARGDRGGAGLRARAPGGQGPGRRPGRGHRDRPLEPSDAHLHAAPGH